MQRWQTSFWGNAHLQTIVPALFRTFPDVHFTRETVTTPDGDFLDIDWLKGGHSKLVILLHGLEGSSDSQYMKGMAEVMHTAGWDVACVNFRGCSGRPNRMLTSYHSGATEDIHFLTQHLQHIHYDRQHAIGFSLGGNVLLKYLGEAGSNANINAAVAISTPCHLHDSAIRLSSGFNKIYLHRFLKRLKAKVREKESEFPAAVDYARVYGSRDFTQFDDAFTAPINGFRDAKDYWQQCSSISFIPAIQTPFLLINALNDPFLTPSCYPHEPLQQHRFGKLETPRFGGHVGFSQAFYDKHVRGYLANH